MAGSPPPVSRSTAGGPGAPTLLAVPANNLRMQAVLPGRLDLLSGCASLVRGARRFPLVWDGGARFADDDGAAILFRGARLRHGDELRAGGGFIDPASQPTLGAQIAEAGCSGHFFLVQGLEVSP